MASKCDLLDVVVIRKTRISEADLVFCMVSSDSSIVNAVGKSARKPGNTFSNRLDLFSVARVSVAKTKGLGIIREAKLLDAHPRIHSDFDLFSCASATAELAWRLTFSENTNDALFDFLVKTFSVIEANGRKGREIGVASLIKLLAMEGFCPAFNFCAKCNTFFDFNDSDFAKMTFSASDGGFLCSDCAKESACSGLYYPVDKNILAACLNYLNLTYEQILSLDDSADYVLQSIKKILQAWMERTVNHRIKALDFL